MKRTGSIFFIGVAALSLLACTDESHEDSSLNGDVIKITYQAHENDTGNCTPLYRGNTARDSDGLPANKIYIMRGETEYFDHNNYKIGEIPFQLKMFRDITGMPSEGLSCQDLFIKITLEKCQYEYPSDRTTCPTVLIEGDEAFGGIEVIQTQ